MPNLLTIITLMAANGFLCTLVEVTLMNVSESYLRSLKETQPELAIRLKKVFDEYEINHAALLGINTLLIVFCSALTGVHVAEIYGSSSVPLAAFIAAICMVAITQVLPRAIANRYWKSLCPFALKVLPALRLLAVPFAAMAEVVKALGLKKDLTPVERSEIETVTEQGFKDGALEISEYHMLNNVLKFKQYRLKDIMIPRENLTAIDPNSSIKEAHTQIISCNNNKFPLFGKNNNEALGYVTRADITQAVLEGRDDQAVRFLARQILTVPHDMRARKLLQKFRARHCEIALIVDDFGEVIGMVAQEDVLETLLSNIQRSAA